MAQGPDNTSVDPLWYKDAVIYELHVKTFCDSDGDGMGDFRGLIDKLDYLQELGITAIWLLPFYPSPLRDDGYDITELVINHTSDQNPWFQKSRRAVAATGVGGSGRAGSKSQAAVGTGVSNDDLAYKDFYVWSDTPEKFNDARIIFKDFETSNWAWDPLAKAYYWHRFYSHQPDLNFDNPAGNDAMEKVGDFCFSRGVEGLRLDAFPSLYNRKDINCENL